MKSFKQFLTEDQTALNSIFDLKKKIASLNNEIKHAAAGTAFEKIDREIKAAENQVKALYKSAGYKNIKEEYLTEEPHLRAALKFNGKVAKAHKGGMHGEIEHPDIAHHMEKHGLEYMDDVHGVEYGFVNHKGHFLDRHKAGEYAHEHGLLKPEYHHIGKHELGSEMIKEMSIDKLKNYVNNSGVHRDPKYPQLAVKKIKDKTVGKNPLELKKRAKLGEEVIEEDAPANCVGSGNIAMPVLPLGKKLVKRKLNVNRKL